ncbi:MAG: hypothetical protein D6725_14685, partial [Planctomycetota bacterium]
MRLCDCGRGRIGGVLYSGIGLGVRGPLGGGSLGDQPCDGAGIIVLRRPGRRRRRGEPIGHVSFGGCRGIGWLDVERNPGQRQGVEARFAGCRPDRLGRWRSLGRATWGQ